MWWTEDGRHLLSSHSDGSYCRWVVGDGDESDEEEKSDIPYGESGTPDAVHSVSVTHRPVQLIAAVPAHPHYRTLSLQGHFQDHPAAHTAWVSVRVCAQVLVFDCACACVCLCVTSVYLCG